MDFKQIQELIKLINKSNIGEVTIEEKGFKITVKQKEEHIQQLLLLRSSQINQLLRMQLPLFLLPVPPARRL